MSDFARKQLEKYGWTKGKGLGKKENGITKPIRAVLKLDTHGIGHDRLNVLASSWWCDAFNEASKRINVVNTKAGVTVTHTKPAVDPILPSPAGIRKTFIKAEASEDMKCPTDESITSPSNSFNLCSDAIYKKCHDVKYREKSMKAKHKRINKQDLIYAQSVKLKRKRSKEA